MNEDVSKKPDTSLCINTNTNSKEAVVLRYYVITNFTFLLYLQIEQLDDAMIFNLASLL